VHPASEHLDGDGLCPLRPDLLQILPIDLSDDLSQGLLEHVEVTYHAPLIALPTFDDDLHPVVMGVQFALRTGYAGHDVKCAHPARGTNFMHTAIP
jgi:hypothetical protein